MKNNHKSYKYRGIEFSVSFNDNTRSNGKEVHGLEYRQELRLDCIIFTEAMQRVSAAR